MSEQEYWVCTVCGTQTLKEWADDEEPPVCENCGAMLEEPCYDSMDDSGEM